MKLLFSLALLIGCSMLSYAQPRVPRPEVQIQRANSPIKVDGVADEPAWQAANVGDSYWQTFPMDTSLAQTKTEFRLTYDDRFVYIAAVC